MTQVTSNLPTPTTACIQAACAFWRGRLARSTLTALLIAGPWAVSSVQAESDKALPVTVVEPFIDLHTGPGRGYPVFYVAEQGDTLEIITARTLWYKVRTRDGKVGWSQSNKLAQTLKPTGVPVDLPQFDHGDYVQSRWRLGFTTGEFEGAETNSVIGGYRFSRWGGAELEAGHIFGYHVDSNYFSLNMLAEPFPQWTVTPFATLSLGKMNLAPEQRLRNREVDISKGQFYGMGLGANYYIGRNFVIRGEYRYYSVTADNDDNIGVAEWKIGFSSFF